MQQVGDPSNALQGLQNCALLRKVLERSGDRKPQVQVTVDTTVILSQVRNLRPI